MERKVVILRTVQTADTVTSTLTDFFQKLMNEVREMLDVAADPGGGEGDDEEILAVRDVTCCVPPCSS